MIQIILLICFIIIISIYFLNGLNHRKLPNSISYPPIEKGLPLIGCIFQIKEPFFQYLWKLSIIHGPIYQVCLGLNQILVLNDFEWIKKCLKDDAVNFSCRYKSGLVHDTCKNCGIVFIDGFKWKTNRSFIMRIFKDFGFGKSRSIEIVRNECKIILDQLNEVNNQSVNFKELISLSTINIISKFIMNKRYEAHDEKLNFILNLITTGTNLKDPIRKLMLMYPFLQKNQILLKVLRYLSTERENFNKLHTYFQEIIEEHRLIISEKSEGEDLMDCFLMEQKSLENKSPELKDAFEDFQLVRMSFELLAAGYETTSSTLVWSMMFLSKFPLVQEIIFKEIIELVGLDKIVDMSDKKNLHYTQAFMDENMRMSSVVPMAIFHSNFNDTIVGDKYFIPKDTLVVPNIYACCRDPRIWEKPFEFYPEHFLKWSVENKSFQYNPREELVVFGMGKRQCLGESLARMEYFVFLVSILQKYKVEFADEVTPQDYEKTLQGPDSIIRSSYLKDFKFINR